MSLRNFVKIFLVIALVAASNLPEYNKCVRLDGESGFFNLLKSPQIKEKSTISVEVKAFNCDDISLTFYNGNDYSFTVRNLGGNREFSVFNGCNGLWHNFTFEVTEKAQFFKDGLLIFMASDFELNAFVNAFHDHELFLKVDVDNKAPHEKPFEGFVRNVRIDNRLQEYVNVHNGTIDIADCPKDVKFGFSGGSVLLNKAFSIDEDFQAYFDVLVPDSSAKCSGLLLSAQDGDSYLIVEYYDNHLYMKFKSGNNTDEVSVSFLFGSFDICDANWHKVGLLKQGNNIKAVVDDTSSSTTVFEEFKFTAPLYIGRNPELRLDSSVDSPISFTGCIRSLSIKGVFPEINQDGFKGDVELNYCSA